MELFKAFIFIIGYLLFILFIGKFIGMGGKKYKAFENTVPPIAHKPHVPPVQKMGPLEYGKADSNTSDYFDEIDRFRNDFS